MDQPPSKEPRGPVSLRIKFRSATLDQFIERYAVDVSRGGIFIRTREPLSVGTQLRFDFQAAGHGAAAGGRRHDRLDPRERSDARRRDAGHGRALRQAHTPASQPVLEKILGREGAPRAGGRARQGRARERHGRAAAVQHLLGARSRERAGRPGGERPAARRWSVAAGRPAARPPRPPAAPVPSPPSPGPGRPESRERPSPRSTPIRSASAGATLRRRARRARPRRRSRAGFPRSRTRAPSADRARRPG